MARCLPTTQRSSTLAQRETMAGTISTTSICQASKVAWASRSSRTTARYVDYPAASRAWILVSLVRLHVNALPNLCGLCATGSDHYVVGQCSHGRRPCSSSFRMPCRSSQELRIPTSDHTHRLEHSSDMLRNLVQRDRIRDSLLDLQL